MLFGMLKKIMGVYKQAFSRDYARPTFYPVISMYRDRKNDKKTTKIASESFNKP